MVHSRVPAAYSPPQVFAVLDEFCLAGEIMETNKRVVIEKMDELDRFD